MGTIAHMLEAGGLATVSLAAVRGQIERVTPARALYCEFPLGRPLGRPNDPAFQRGVMDAAFELLKETSGPVLKDFPETIQDAFAEPLACAIPPRHDPDLPEAVDEAQGLRPAYDRNRAAAGKTLVGRSIDADGVGDAIRAFIKIAEGTPWKEAGVPGHPLQVVKDIQAYYEEAAAALVDHVPGARASESWFYKSTATGKVIHAARKALHEAKQGWSFYLIPFTQG